MWGYITEGKKDLADNGWEVKRKTAL